MSLVDELHRPAAWGAPETASVEMVETHISWVFLLERDVFKVKKPVSLGFLDFRALEDRKAACDAEVTLNARLAPDVYHGVVALRRQADGSVGLGGDRAIVEWAVHMARLPDERRADFMLAANQLTAAHVDALADRLAAFHALVRCDEETARFGRPGAIAVNVQENFQQTRDVMSRYVSAAEAAEIVRWQTRFLHDHERLFAERIAAGRVRDGHGDLRLEHAYFVDERSPLLVDCIEFNERFRFADVCADVAFLSMDLASHGRVDLAERFLARYAQQANDFDLYALVDFYESYRAFVRGKIATMVGDAAGARRHFLLALAADRRSLLAPVLVAVGGIIASGKSTIAEHVARELSAPIVDADRTRKAMLGVEATKPLDERAWKGAYDPDFTEKVYAEVLRRAEVVLASGRPVVLDASFRSPTMRAAARALARRYGAPFRFVECRAEVEVCRSRLVTRARERGVSDGRLEVFDAFRQRFEKVVELSPLEHVVLDTSRPIEDSLRALRARIATWPHGFVA
ncbi:MAG TPA: AAA family ATPase [Polyangiaceae bacterium]|nr:AAA family ATPase [Polyangiaceae bacterium]